MKSGGGGGGQFASGPLRKVGGGGSDVSSPIGVWEKLHKPGLAPHKRTLTLLGGGGGGVRSNPPEPPPPGYRLDVFTCMHASVWLCVCVCSSCKKFVRISASAMQTCACM